MFLLSEIPEELLKHADMVIRESNIELKLLSRDNAVYTCHSVYTLLNKAAEGKLSLSLTYNKSQKVKDISYFVYDKDGNEIEKVKKSEIKDYSAISGFSIFDETRVKYIHPGEFDYPITVECTYEYEFDGYISYPRWSPVNGYNVAVQSSVFDVTVNPDASFRYKEFNTDSLTVKIDEINGRYSWEAKNVRALEYESFHTSIRDFVPIVYAAPSTFKLEGYDGDLSTWKSFGLWIKNLNDGRDELSEEIIAEIKSMTEGISDNLEKAKVLYEYMQNNSRYVSIQVGIGSMQPMKASDVCRLAYGDCKALSYYMKTILKVAGIESFYTLINAGAGADPVMTDFPSMQFNHAILCVPFSKDTVWLECTSQNIPFGYLGKFTDNRYGLLIKPEGGQLVKTKEYTIDDNVIISKAEVDFNPTGNSLANVKVEYNGLYYDYMRSLLVGTDDEKKKEMYRRIDLPGFKIKNFNHEVKKDITPAVIETIDLELENFCSNMGNRSFFNPNLLNRKRKDLRRYLDRLSEVQIDRSYTLIDTITYRIPEGYKVMGLRDPIEFETDFGSYKAEFISLDNNLYYIRKREIFEGIYPKEKYLDLVDFYDQIIKADNTKLAVKKI